MKNDYIPRKDSDLLLWHDQFLAGATAHGTALGLTAPDLAAITTDNENLHSDVTNSDTADAEARSATATKRATVKRVVTAARGYAQHIKTASNYDPAMGQSLGIEGSQNSTDLASSQPTLSAKAKTGGSVEIGFDKSTSDGVNLYCRRDGDPASVFLARDTATPYLDTRPLLVAGKPEVREYRAIYVVNDVEIGNFSDEVVVTAVP